MFCKGAKSWLVKWAQWSTAKLWSASVCFTVKYQLQPFSTDPYSLWLFQFGNSCPLPIHSLTLSLTCFLLAWVSLILFSRVTLQSVLFCTFIPNDSLPTFSLCCYSSFPHPPPCPQWPLAPSPATGCMTLDVSLLQMVLKHHFHS